MVANFPLIIKDLFLAHHKFERSAYNPILFLVEWVILEKRRFDMKGAEDI